MTPFQIVALFCLAALVVWEIRQVRRGGFNGGSRLVRIGVWLAAAAGVAQPQLLQYLANLLGIGRGTDVLLYLLVFAFLGTSFFLYARTVVLQRQLTQLVRRYALDNAARGGGQR